MPIPQNSQAQLRGLRVLRVLAARSRMRGASRARGYWVEHRFITIRAKNNRQCIKAPAFWSYSYKKAKEIKH
jgi:hypothetical protein